MSRTESAHSGSAVRGFAARVVLAMLSVVLALQLANLLSTRYAVSTAVRDQLHRELEVGQRVWEESHRVRLAQLADRALVLAEDFGFREAIATGDPPTLASALANAGSRIGAPYALLLDPQGGVLASLLPERPEAGSAVLSTLLERARVEGVALGVSAVGERAVSFAIVPVFAPQLVAWVGMGVPLDDEQLGDYSAITGLGVGLLLGDRCQMPAAQGRLADWAVSQELCTALAGDPPFAEFTGNAELGGQPLLALRLSEAPGRPVYLLISSSREQAMQPFLRLDRQVFWLALVSVLVAVLVATWIGRRVSRPVSELAMAAQRIGEGDYATPLPVRGGDELAALAGAFNRMQQGIAEREQRIVHQAGHDALTGLPNRERALLAVRDVLAAAGSDAAAAGGLIKLDIRRFREINDLFGHDFGDRVLVQVARSLERSVREQDLVARLGSNEFLVLLRGVAAGDALRRAQRLAEAMGALQDIEGTAIRLDVALGLALFPEPGVDDATLMRRADVALDEAKASGQAVLAYQAGHDERHLRQLRLIGDLRGAVERAELNLVFQPKVRLADGVVAHGEALLRWLHPQLGRIAPDEFIPLAERSGLIGMLSGFVLDQALAQAAAWQAEGIGSGVAINLSAIDLGYPGLGERVLEALRRHRVAPARLIVEVTESAVMRDLDKALETLHRLRRMGIKVAVDDFGTGQSSLAQLKRLPVDELKIDKSFVIGMLPGTEDEQIVESIIRLAHALQLSVVAEGVEDEVALRRLAEHGCESVQGYYFSRPLSGADYAIWCRERASLATASGPTA